HLLHGLNANDWRAAQDLLRQLTSEARDFSPAFSSAVQLDNTRHIVFPGQMRDREQHAAALRRAQHAVQLDPHDSRAQLAIAWAYQLVGQASEATLHAELAVDLNPNDPWTLIAAAQILSYCGDYARSITLCTQSMDLSPQPTVVQRAYASAIYFLARRYDECVEVGTDELVPSPGFLIWRCASLVQLGNIARARDLLRSVVDAVKAKWAGNGPPDERAVHHWLLHMSPIAVE